MVQHSNVDLGEEMPDMLLNKHRYAVNIKTLQAADQMMQSVLDIKEREECRFVRNEWVLFLRNGNWDYHGCWPSRSLGFFLEKRFVIVGR